jgi:hypothetical protein
MNSLRSSACIASTSSLQNVQPDIDTVPSAVFFASSDTTYSNCALQDDYATKMKNMAAYDKRLAREGRWLLGGNTKILQPDDFLRELFEETNPSSA